MKARLSLLTLTLVVSTLGVSAGLAQAPEITLDTHPASSQIQLWLSSGDPRLVAWGAHFANEQNDAAALALATKVLEELDRSPLPAAYRSPEFLSRAALLDALIQRNIAVPAAGIAALPQGFAVQAAILASQLPLADSTPLLLDWYGARIQGKSNFLATVAALLLSHKPPPGFAARVLANEEMTLTISVVTPAGGRGFGFGTATCGDSFGTTSDSGWPPVYVYGVTESPSNPSAPVLAEAAGERITYVRHEVHSGWGSCSSESASDPETDHHALAQMLDLADAALPFPAFDQATIEWQTDDQFYREAERDVTDEEAKFSGVAQALYEKQLITAGERLNVRPRLTVKVEDSRNPKGTPLPELHFSDPRTTLARPRPTPGLTPSN